MKTHVIAILLSLFCCTTESFASQKNRMSIDGTVDLEITKLFMCSELTIRINYTSNRQSTGEKIVVPIDSLGNFKFPLSFDDPFVYLSFEFEDKAETNNKGIYWASSHPQERDMKESYLFLPSDSINLDIKKDGRMIFSGIGSEKLTCQSEIYSIQPISPSISSRLSELKSIEQKLSLMEDCIELAIKLRLKILSSYKNAFSKKVYALLYLDAVASAQYSLLTRQGIVTSYGTEADIKIAEQHFMLNLFENYLSNIEIEVKSESAYYADVIFIKEYCSALFQDKLQNMNLLNVIYTKILNTYEGDLRDKLLFICFEKLTHKYSTESKELGRNALSLMRNTQYRKLLTALLEKGNMAFQFDKLYDINGKEHKLIEYNGKVLVIDFWFTGCGGCLALAKDMHPIVEKFKENKNIIFMTISTDLKKVWESSVASGLYSSLGVIDLHTGGLGFGHPLILYYNFQSFPRQLIIGKDGRLITSTPPPPYNQSNSKAFVDLINGTLINH